MFNAVLGHRTGHCLWSLVLHCYVRDMLTHSPMLALLHSNVYSCLQLFILKLDHCFTCLHFCFLLVAVALCLWSAYWLLQSNLLLVLLIICSQLVFSFIFNCSLLYGTGSCCWACILHACCCIPVHCSCVLPLLPLCTIDLCTVHTCSCMPCCIWGCWNCCAFRPVLVLAALTCCVVSVRACYCIFVVFVITLAHVLARQCTCV